MTRLQAFKTFVNGALPNLTLVNQQHLLRFTHHLPILVQGGVVRIQSYDLHRDTFEIELLYIKTEETVLFQVNGDNLTITKTKTKDLSVSMLANQLLHT